MVENFYYLATYTAAVAAGFTPRDGLAIARAARYVEECAGLTVPAADRPSAKDGPNIREQLEIWPVFHYLPGDYDQILKEMNPGLPYTGGPEVLLELPILCREGGALTGRIVEFAKGRYGPSGRGLTEEERLQTVGIVMHVLADTLLHQGFAGVPSPVLNEVGGILTAKPCAPAELRDCLDRALREPAAGIFQMEPYTKEPAGEYLGCQRLGSLTDSPAQIFTYLSAWTSEPLTSWVNPLRFAAAFARMRQALRYIRGWDTSFSQRDDVQEVSERLDLACFFAGIRQDADLPEAWGAYFPWLPMPSPYQPPQIGVEEAYIYSFKVQAMAYRDMVWSACPELTACAVGLGAGDVSPVKSGVQKEGSYGT